MEPIVVPMHVRWFSGTTASPKTYGTGTLVKLVKKNGLVTAEIVETGTINVVGSSGAQYIGRFVQPPNVKDAQRGTKDVILFEPAEKSRYVILADPLVLNCEQTLDNSTKKFYADVYISAAVGGVVEFDFGPHVQPGHRLGNLMTASESLAVASAPIFLEVSGSSEEIKSSEEEATAEAEDVFEDASGTLDGTEEADALIDELVTGEE